MAKGTILFLFILVIIASLLFGINIGKRLEKSQLSPSPTLTISKSKNDLITLSPVPASTTSAAVNGKITYSNPNCGYQITYPATWIKFEKDQKSVALAVSDASGSAKIGLICAADFPTPSISSDKITSYKLGSLSAQLYPDSNTQEGLSLDEIITVIPGKNMKLLIAGSRQLFPQILPSFRILH